ncbi:hypothetical protein YQE_09561, partial [Dendroctonus ponderosae]
MSIKSDKKDDIPDDGIYYSADKGPTFGVRFVQIIVMAICYGHLLTLKTVFSITIVAMTSTNSTTSGSTSNAPTYDWTNQNIILSTALWSGIPTNLAGGYIGKKYGPKWLIVSAMVVNSVAFMLIPLSAQYLGSMGVLACRFVEGLSMGIMIPLTAVVMGIWAPHEERSRLGFLVSARTLLMTTAVICTTYIPEQLRIWAVVLYCIVTIADESISMTGVSVNIYDLSPKYAGIITGISHSISQGVSAFAPSLVDWVCTDLSDASQWRTVFIITSVIALSSAIFFAIFASSQRQNWGTESEEDARIEAVIKRKGSIFSIYSLAA